MARKRSLASFISLYKGVGRGKIKIKLAKSKYRAPKLKQIKTRIKI